jgi:hypothetical protein
MIAEVAISDSGDHGRPDIPGESENHQNDEADGDPERDLHVIDRGFDGLGPIAGNRERDARPRRGGQGRQAIFYTFDRFYYIETAPLVDVDDDRPLVLQPSGLLCIFRSIDRSSDIRDADGCAALIGDD